MTALRLIGIVALAGTVVAAAQVPLSQEPSHRMTFENAELRVLDVNVPPGGATLDHRHDFDIVTVSMTSGTPTRLQQAGGTWGPIRPPRPLGDAAAVEYAGKPESYRLENVGTSAYRLFAVENLRTGEWSAGAAASGRGTTLTTTSRAFRIYDVRLGREISQTSHTHTAPTISVLVTGAVLSDGPDTQAKANPSAPVGIKQLTEQGQWILVPRGDTHHLVRLGTADARVVEIEVR